MKNYGGIISVGALAILLALSSGPVLAQDEEAQDNAATQDSGDQESGDTSSDAADGSASDAGGSTDKAREALKQKDSDATEQKNLEEVFQATENQYSLLKSGGMSMQFSGDYSYYRNDRIDINFDDNGNINRFRIQQDAQHSFGASLSLDYGIWDNLTFNTRLPVSYKYDTQKNVSQAALGDVSFGLRYQPFPVKPGEMNTTLYTTFSTATGDSPYEIDTTREVSSGKGYYSLGGGVSVSKVVDPVVLFGSLGYTHSFDASGLDQARGSRVLDAVRPGDSLSFSGGLAYSLSYEVSISASYQQSYNFATNFEFTNGDTVSSEDSTSSILNMSLGLRSASNRIVNVSFGFGLTEDSPDVLLGFSVPMDITGLKSGN